jgi:hypothetical protein
LPKTQADAQAGYAKIGHGKQRLYTKDNKPVNGNQAIFTDLRLIFCENP